MERRKVERSSTYGKEGDEGRVGPGVSSRTHEAVLEARDGDVLVVQFPEQKVGIPNSYSSVTLAGLTYSRRLVAGDDPGAEYDRIYAFLKARAERDGRERLREFAAEVEASRKRSG